MSTLAAPDPFPRGDLPGALRASSTPAAGLTDTPPRRESQPRLLSPLLVWAVVFCDIGTSVYYVPGILYGQVGAAAPLFVLGTTIGFLLLSAKYVEICWRHPEGGGVVTVASKAFNPRWGCFGGMLITVDYFLTSAISSVSGTHYLASLFPGLDSYIVGISAAALVFLALINLIGIRESAIASLFMAVSALIVDVAVVAVTWWQIGPPHWQAMWHHLSLGSTLSPTTFLVGFAGAWLAFSGLESISQLSPAMREPLKRSATRGMWLVVASILVTSPLLTLFSVALLPEAVKGQATERFISELGAMWGGMPMKVAVVCTASVLLMFAANTAIIGGYHVFLALARQGFFPGFITARNRRFGTPHYAIAIATVVPLVVVLATRGNLTILGEMYAFGLLGAFVLSSLGLDVIRWRAQARGPWFWVGLLTTAMVLVSWCVNLVTKPLATFFGGGLTAIGMTIAIAGQQKRFSDLLHRVPAVARRTRERIHRAEDETEEVPELVSLGEACELRQLYPSKTLVALRGPNVQLLREAINRERGHGGNTVYCLYVEERPGLFVGSAASQPDAEGIETLSGAVDIGEEAGVTVVPVWTISYSAAEGIARAARDLRVDTVMMGVSRRNAIYHLLRGHVVNGLVRELPQSCHILLHN
jgi:amino acid transporter/nucleotide-binding universal stress UspA family protein